MMKLRGEPIWWLPLARRIAGWSAAMMVLWGLPGALIITAFANWYFGEHRYMILGGETFSWAFVANDCAAWSFVMSFVAGAFCAFFAPARAPGNPLRSQFFKRVWFDTVSYFTLFSVLLLCPLFFDVTLL